MKSIKKILMERGMSSEDADDLIEEAKADLEQRLDAGEVPYDICEDWFGLEPDYLGELIS